MYLNSGLGYRGEHCIRNNHASQVPSNGNCIISSIRARTRPREKRTRIVGPCSSTHASSKPFCGFWRGADHAFFKGADDVPHDHPCSTLRSAALDPKATEDAATTWSCFRPTEVQAIPQQQHVDHKKRKNARQIPHSLCPRQQHTKVQMVSSGPSSVPTQDRQGDPGRNDSEKVDSPARQPLQGRRPHHPSQWPAKIAAERQLLEEGRPLDSSDELVELAAERKLQQGGRPNNSNDRLVELTPERKLP